MSNQITPNPSVPTQIVAEGLKFPKFINNLGIIPTSYKDSMSYYETLAWFCKYLEDTVIPTLNQNGEAVEELQDLYIKLNNYVTHYFDTLDVQEEINNKLDSLVSDGTIPNIIDELLSNFTNAQFTPVSSTSEMSDTSKIYINTTDGYWYYYNGTNWAQGGTYQGILLPDNSVSPKQTTFMYDISILPEGNYVNNKILNYTSGNPQDFNGASYSEDYIKIDRNKIPKITSLLYQKAYILPKCYFYDENYQFISYISLSALGTIFDIPTTAYYMRFGFQAHLGYPDKFVVFYLEDYLNGENLQNKSNIKDSYIQYDDSKLLYNNKKLNIIRGFGYDSLSDVLYTISGNKVHFDFDNTNTNTFYCGFNFSANFKVGDIVKFKIYNKPSNINNIVIYKTGDGLTSTNTSVMFDNITYDEHGEAYFTITSEILNNLINKTLSCTQGIPGITEESEHYDFTIEVSINGDFYYFSDFVNYVLDNKVIKENKAIFLGDSITALTGNRAWWTYMNEILNIRSYNNVAVYGAHLKDYSDSVYDGNPVYNGPDDNHNNVLGNQVQKIINNQASYVTPDFIFIAIGTNDGISSTINDSYNAYYDSQGNKISINSVNRQTASGAFRYCYEKLHDLYPNAKIFWCTPIQAANTVRNVKDVIGWGDSLKNLCAVSSNICIDTEKCGINSIYETQGTEGEDLIDGLHPNASGAMKMGIYNAAEVIKFCY